MNRRHFLIAVMIAWALGLSATRAGAFPVTFYFAGTVTDVLDPDGLLGGGVIPGDAFSGTYTFESTTPDALPDNSTVGAYHDATTAMSGQLGALPVQGPAAGYNAISVVNNSFGFDAYVTSTRIRLLEMEFRLAMNLRDDSGTVFSSDALPLVAPPFAFFDSAVFSIDTESIPVMVLGEMTSLVPEPGVLALVALGSPVLMRRRRVRA